MILCFLFILLHSILYIFHFVVSTSILPYPILYYYCVRLIHSVMILLLLPMILFAKLQYFLTETALGYYMYVEASQGKSFHLATLESPVLKQASAKCVFNFYYHMYGSGIGELRVYIVVARRYTLLWSLYGDQG